MFFVESDKKMFAVALDYALSLKAKINIFTLINHTEDWYIVKLKKGEK